MSRGRIPLPLVVVLVGALASAAAEGHPLAPALLSLSQQPAHESEVEGSGAAATRWQVAWKVPLRAPIGVQLEPVLPLGCERVGEPEQLVEGTGLVTRFPIDCAAPLTGLVLGVQGLQMRGAAAVVRVARSDAPAFQQVVTAANPTVVIPERPTRLAVAGDYAALGVSHLLFGLDHVLFVLGLLLLVSGGRALLATVTAFTLGHSATLSLAALGVVNFPTAWVEVAIAVTLVATALEIAPRARERSLFGQAPWRVAFVFGLLHGLGFAGALAGIGLPEGEIPLALLAFNVGIEFGQLAIVAAALALYALSRAVTTARPPQLRWVAAYGIGGLSAYWLIERLGAALRI